MLSQQQVLALDAMLPCTIVIASNLRERESNTSHYYSDSWLLAQSLTMANSILSNCFSGGGKGGVHHY